MAREIEDAVVVITGASSGIGRAAAQAFAERRARLVLASRDGEGLGEVVRACERHGGAAEAFPTDVRDESRVEALAARAVELHGQIDVWVNNAAVTLFGRFEETPSDAYRQVFETNLFGYVHGLRSALRRFREQGSGVAVNVLSAVADAPQPYTSAYVSTKYALRGLLECLRMELALDEDHDIHLCAVLPPSVDTPLFQHAANYTGRAVKPMDPVLPVERVADAIVDAARKPRREVRVGAPAYAMKALKSVAPGTFERVMARQVDREHLKDEAAAPSEGNLYSPHPDENAVSGGWRADGGSSKRKIAAAAAVALAVPAILWAAR